MSVGPPIPATLSEVVRSLGNLHRREDQLFAWREGEWTPQSSAESFETIRSLAAGLAELGLRPGDRVGLLSRNRPEWVLMDLAIAGSGLVTVPIYPNLPYNEVRAILGDSGARAVFVADADQYAKVERAWGGLPDLETAAVFDPWGLPDDVVSLAQVQERGEERLRREPDLWERLSSGVEPGALATIIYTSGTTGAPKGVMLTHANICSNIDGVLRVISILPEDRALSFLPLAHVFERLVMYAYLTCGASVAFARSIDRLGDDFLEVRPTIVATVPRVLEKIRDRALGGARRMPPVLRGMALWAVRVGEARGDRAREGRGPGPWLAIRAALADALVLRRLREHLGGRMRLVISGGAPLAPEVGRFFWGARIPVIEGYGLTETSPVIALNPPERPRLGTVGPSLDNLEVRIAEDGEVLVRGPSITGGYWNAPEATGEAFRDGWFLTGDLGEIDSQGYLRITGRKKEIIVTSGGKNVAPAKVEALLAESPLVARAVVVGDRRPYLCALIVPDPDALEGLARNEGFAGLEGRGLLDHPRVRERFRGELDRLQAGLASFETVKRFHLLERDLTVDEGLLTPTLKTRRGEVATAFAREIEALYES